MIYFLDVNQEVIKIVRNSAILSAIQTQELPEDNSLLRDYLSVRLKNDERLFNAQYMAVKSYGGNRNAFDLYRIASELVPDNATEFMGIQVAPYELEGVVIEDLRPQNRPLNQTMNQVLEGSDWRLGYVSDNLPNVTTNFYYTSVKDALKKIQELLNVEMLFKVEISGNKITDKWVEVYHQLGNRTMKRFNYGTNALSVVRESSHDELYTALIGRGKGEEVGETESGDATYGRKINFADVEWQESAGNPVNKPKGQKYIELPNATAEYGIKLLDGRKVPRIGIVEFSDTDDPNVLINQTYQELLVRARPKVLFKASVINTGDMLIGDTVTIHRHDLGFHYQARVRKVVRDRRNNNKTQVEIGDVVHTPSTKRQGQINSALDNVSSDLENVRGEITEARQSADGKNTNFYGNVEPERKKVGDTWFRDHPSLTGESQILVWNGEAWELIMDTSDTTKNADAIAEQQQEIEEAKQTADEAVDSINTAVANAGFTSLDDTIQTMNYITMNAEQSAQQAITDASNAYGLAQTSISEAQTAQANSLTALGKADNALDGVSNLDVRVDDVEAELELKADNTFMNEDGTLTTLSNAITFNAYRFSSDMSRIESRVESLSGEINLVILRDAFENRILYGGETYPNAPVSTFSDVMREMINVVAGEELALSKNAVDGDNTWRISFYDNSHNYVTRAITSTNQHILTVPAGATKMWVSYPKNSKPQIVRGTSFIPYRPNLADQMTSEEVNIFRNQYDEFADKTERRLTAIDSSDGRLATAELLITQTANGLALKADQTTVNELTGEVESLGTEFDIVAGQVSSKVWMADIDDIEIGGRNYFVDHLMLDIDNYERIGSYHYYTINNLSPEEVYTVSVRENFTNDITIGSGANRALRINNDKTGSLGVDIIDVRLSHGIRTYEREIRANEEGQLFLVSYIPSLLDEIYKMIQIEKGNKVTDWTPAPEDTDAKIDHIETEWTQTFESFQQDVTHIDGRVTSQRQDIDSITSTVSVHNSRLSTVEQTADGLQSTVANKAEQSEVTQLATAIQSKVSNDIFNSEIGQLANNINLRVAKGDVVSQLNIDAGRTLISSSKILLNANTVSISGTAWMSGAVIANASIDGAKITDATISSAKIASLDAGKISTGTLKSIDIEGVRIVGGTINGAVFNQNDSRTDYSVGRWDHLGISIRHPDDSLTMNLTRGGFSLGGTSTIGSETYITNNFLRVHDSDIFNLNVTGTLTVSNTSSLLLGQRLRMNNSAVQFTGPNIPPGYDRSIWYGYAYDGNAIYAYTAGAWHRVSNVVSDRRLKDNILISDMNALGYIESWEFVEFDWKNPRAYGEGRQFGLIAQQAEGLGKYFPEVDRWEIDHSKQTMLNSLAIQQLALREQNTNLVASQALEATETNEEKIHQLQKELSKANRRIEELESVM